MKSVLISIQPKYCELIANGKKTIEVRKSRPKIETPFKCYIYCTNDRKIVLDSDTDHNFFIDKNRYEVHYYNGKVIGDFVCDRIDKLPCEVNQPFWLKEKTCIDDEHYKNYLGNKNGYGWHISDLKIYDNPKELIEFYVYKEVKGGCENCAYYRTPTLEFCQDCKRGNPPKKYLTRPPQSWGYVEELK